jgi:uncharacterized repeat protein (TIGR03803 family)
MPSSSLLVFSRSRQKRSEPSKHGVLKKTCATILLWVAGASPVLAQTVTTLDIFLKTNGSTPVAPLMQGSDGNFYGTTGGGGANGSGTIFRLKPSGELTLLYNFCSQNPRCVDGAHPAAGLVEDAAGDFYGTTLTGGGSSDTWGTVFKFGADGSLTTLHSFTLGDGAYPGGLVQGSDGDFYGITYQGGVNTGCFDGTLLGCGTIFKLTPAGVFTTLYNFCSQTNCADGANPVGQLVQGTDGNFYGAAARGGSNNADCLFGCGTVFKFDPTGALTTLYSFCPQSGCTDGVGPEAGLVLGTDGNFYGTTFDSDPSGAGTIFQITSSGELAILHRFCPQVQVPCVDGGGPAAALVQGRDGSFYGTTTTGGAHAGGSVFKIEPSGVYTTVFSFCSRGTWPHCVDQTPESGVVQGTDGYFYGTTSGYNNIARCLPSCGTLFRFGIDVALKPTSAIVGRKVTITGLNLTGATAVSFDGVAAAFTVVSGTQITTNVPAGALTGPVRVTTPGGTLTSNTNFLVPPKIHGFKPLGGPVGTVVAINGVSLSQATQVTFGGFAATTFTVNSDTRLTATVPSGAITGTIGITTPGGTTASLGTFTVTP